MKLTILELGRMQFEIMDSRWNFTAGERMVKKGDPIISIHIPQGEKLTLESVRESILYREWLSGEKRCRICVIPGCSIRGLKTFCRRKAISLCFRINFRL